MSKRLVTPFSNMATATPILFWKDRLNWPAEFTVRWGKILSVSARIKAWGTDSYLIDAQSWMCSILGACGNSEYAETLELVAAKASNGQVRRSAAKGLRALNR